MKNVMLFENKSLVTTSIYSIFNALQNSFELLLANLLDDDGSTSKSSKNSSNDDEEEIDVPNFNDSSILSSVIGKETGGDEDEDDE